MFDGQYSNKKLMLVILLKNNREKEDLNRFSVRFKNRVIYDVKIALKKDNRAKVISKPLRNFLKPIIKIYS